MDWLQTIGVVTGVVVLAVVGFKLYRAYKRSAFIARTKKGARNVVYLYTPKRWSSRLASFSSWSLKLEAFLRLNKIPYIAEFVDDFSLSPTETLPFIGLNGVLVGDSQQCIEYISKELGINMDSFLTAEQQATGTLLRRLLEDNVSPNNYRTVIVDNMANMVPVMKEYGAPRLLMPFILRMYRNLSIKRLNASGLGDLSDERYQEEQRRNFKALETLIGNKKFIFGDKPSSYDLGAFALLSFVLALKPFLQRNNSGVSALFESKILTAYVERFNALVYPDLEKIVRTNEKSQEFLTY